MKIADDDASRMLEEECPGSPDLESALANESVGSAASHPALVLDASTSLNHVLQIMREGGRGAALVVSSGTLVGRGVATVAARTTTATRASIFVTSISATSE